MNYEVRVTQVDIEKNPNLKGFASITFGNSFAVNNITVFQGKNGLFVNMPKYASSEKDEQDRTIYKEVCFPKDPDFKADFTNNIISVYKNCENGKGKQIFNDERKMNLKVQVSNNTISNSTKRADVRLTLGEVMVIDRVAVMRSWDGKEFVAMPSQKIKGEFKDVCFPCTKEFRENLYDKIMEKYQVNKKQKYEKRVTQSKRKRNVSNC